MNDTTKWIMIILLLLLIGAAVFMLLRSPGKENGAVDVPPADADRDGIPDAREGRAGVPPVDDRGVYDQAAEVAPAEQVVVDEPGVRADEPTTVEPVGTAGATYAEPLSFDDGEAEAYRPEAGAADTTSPPLDDGGALAAGGARPLTDEEIEAGGREEPLEGEGQEPDVPLEEAAGEVVDEPSRQPVQEDARGGWDPDGPDVGEAAALGAAAATGGGATAATSAHGTPAVEEPVPAEPVAVEPVAVEPVAVEPVAVEPVAVEPTLEEPAPDPVAEDVSPATEAAPAASSGIRQEAPPTEEGTDVDAGPEEYPVGDESTTYRAHGGSAVRVDEPPAGDTGGLEEAPAAPAPADASSGPPQTADDIAAGYPDAEVVPVSGPGGASTADASRAPVFAEAAYGAGSAEPLEDGSGPAGWEIKGNTGSMLFHTPESPIYDGVRAEVWFESEDAARTAGFAHWDRRRR